MKNRLVGVLAVLFVAAAALPAQATVWIEGQHYFRIDPAAAKPLAAGTVEVMEVFSYGCPACNQFNPIAHELRLSLPANARLVYLPASFIPAEDWPMFQRAFCTAQLLGVAEKAHDDMFDAVWKTGELSVTDPMTGRIKNPMPSIADAAKFYQRVTGIPVERFLKTAQSPAVAAKMQEADTLIRAYEVDSTPTIIVNRMYRVTPRSAGGYDELIELVGWLLTKSNPQH